MIVEAMPQKRQAVLTPGWFTGRSGGRGLDPPVTNVRYMAGDAHRQLVITNSSGSATFTNNQFVFPTTGWAWGTITVAMVLSAGVNGIRFTNDPNAGPNQSNNEVYYDNLTITTGSASGDTVTWTMPDRQGNVGFAFSDVSTVAQRNRYLPYGTVRGADAIAVTQKGFVGQIEDPTGLDYLNARYYDPTLTRFISVDPVLNLSNPQTLNRVQLRNGQSGDVDGSFRIV